LGWGLLEIGVRPDAFWQRLDVAVMVAAPLIGIADRSCPFHLHGRKSGGKSITFPEFLRNFGNGKNQPE